MRLVAAEVGAFPLGPFVVPGAILGRGSCDIGYALDSRDDSMGEWYERGASPRGPHVFSDRLEEM